MGVLSDQFTPIPTSGRQHRSQRIRPYHHPLTQAHRTHQTHTREIRQRQGIGWNVRNRWSCVLSTGKFVYVRACFTRWHSADEQFIFSVGKYVWSVDRIVAGGKKKSKKRTKSDIGRPRTPQNHHNICIDDNVTPTLSLYSHPTANPTKPPPCAVHTVYDILLFTVKFIHAYASRHGWVGRYLLALVIMVHDTGDKSIDACDNAY